MLEEDAARLASCTMAACGHPEAPMPALADPPPSLARIAPAVRTLVTHHARGSSGRKEHDRQSRRTVARRLAEVIGCPYGGDYDAAAGNAGPLYFVPDDALLAAEAETLGIRGPQDLFGGVVPSAFMATKAITHPLVARDAAAPAGWSHAFAAQAGDTVLRGYTAFAAEDARRAALRLLREGPVRIKCVAGTGGARQHVARSAQDVDAALATIGAREVEQAGVAVEEQVAERVTFAVGVVECAGVTIAYCGTQRTTRNASGDEVYGGSTLDVLRGDFAALLASDLPPDRRAAVELARSYDAAAFAAYPRAFASRRNYDVLFGSDGAGRARAGVLEQSWRIGGASAAEVLALAAFQRDPARTRVRCATVEIYDDACPVPEGAFVHYRGVDAHVGPLTKYAVELDGRDA
jgi:hypothetical protein